MTFEEWAKEYDLDNEYPTRTGREIDCRAAWEAATKTEREACANQLTLTRAEAQLMAGEMTAQEWRTVSAVLVGLQKRMRSNV